MRTAALGDGLTVSALGLGAMGMSAFYGSSDEAESVATLRYAVDSGVTFVDTAEAYGPFTNERLIARALGECRDRVTLATKASAETDDDGTVHGRNGTPAYIRRACDRSLRHLGTDVIDLYYLHRVDPNVPIEESVGAMSELVAAGKVRAPRSPRSPWPGCSPRTSCPSPGRAAANASTRTPRPSTSRSRPRTCAG